MLLGSPGEKAQVSLFGVKAEGAKFVYVLDRSGSTGGKVLNAAKAEILASIEKIDDVHQFQLVVYNERPKAFNPAGPNGQLAFGTDANRAEVKKFLGSIEADGGTDHAAALSLAIRMRPDVIFLLTDGDKPLLNARELARIDRIGPGIMIHTIQFGEGPQTGGRGWMGKLAQQTRRRVQVRRYNKTGSGNEVGKRESSLPASSLTGILPFAHPSPSHSPPGMAGMTKILPSPMRPVRAISTITRTTSSTRRSSTQSVISTLGKKAREYSLPRYSSR